MTIKLLNSEDYDYENFYGLIDGHKLKYLGYWNGPIPDGKKKKKSACLYFCIEWQLHTSNLGHK